ncbi:flagellar hook assembly protein FlgD [Ideonella sp. A 288]|uniref:flagellar hook assembly protein FlgD n=1 Tax=Ideonella sp. A 288 TaxID=1962181 RepID=UPI000B4BBC12|nr:flagellar hook capping FlgD N-terminal domain-containing protein [Ideonella sp. A 288]
MAVTATTPTPTTPASPFAAFSTATNGDKSTAASASKSAQEQSDRFLTLLVTQMKNQDPLNPMDNAQITTQMAQISTVSGIDKLAASVGDMNGLLLQMQSLEGAALVGKDVLVAGKQLVPGAEGATTGGFDLNGSARNVVVSVKDAGGKVIDTIDLGQLPAGRHTFDWTAPDPKAVGLTFEVSALNGAQPVTSTRLMADRVQAVHTEAGQLTVELLRSGNVKYSDVKAVS